MIDQILDMLVAENAIKRYSYANVDEEGNVGKESRFRNTQRLTLELNSGQRLQIDSFCSGCSENTTLHFELVDGLRLV